MLLPHPDRDRSPIRVALTGANGGYGRTFLAQVTRTPELIPAVLVDPDVDGVLAMLTELGLAARALVSEAPTRTAQIVADGGIALVRSADAIAWGVLDVLVEACGKVPQGTAYAAAAIDNDTHVVMVSKEVDTVAGVALHARAVAGGLSYLPGDGDQPANLLRMLDWVSAVGLDIVAIGKAGEYDLQFDPVSGKLTQAGETIDAPSLRDLLTLGDDVHETLEQRAQAASELKRAAAADSCEMTVVAMRTGASADTEAMHYPVARIDELADIYASREHGGLVGTDGAVDVFSALRLPGEASFAGGVFAVVRTGDPVTWEVLRAKGHVLSRDGRYACVYWPYHYMGVETPLTVHAAVDRAPAPSPRATTVLAARAVRDLPKGDVLAVRGHHHEIDGAAPVMLGVSTEAAAYYLLDGARLVRDVPAGELIRESDVEGLDPLARDLHREGRALTPATRDVTR
ncbi:SAF domain-containing protein [Brachybacterium sacelli]|uniref:Homoserine dehydrogenase-like protein n=1 Tax=Brachybacterium sacelli TaxID=173364 RepID=A0ABS4WZ93_9MICO|nr:SAF domain-containing protein [Brachybacterium sacelli]MBP2381416.1 putative homoserine dehydrogenase-like protein [Brachybacterium sacelli]